jgi:hypothetical protein
MQNQSSPGTVKRHLSERLGQLDAITGAQEDRRGIADADPVTRDQIGGPFPSTKTGSFRWLNFSTYRL